MRKRFGTAALCLVLMASLCGCDRLSAPIATPTEATVRPRVTVTPAPTLNNEPAALYKSVATEQRVVSLVLEGYTDVTTMRSLADLFAARNVPCVFFITGVTASEQPEIVRAIAEAGLDIGNYGITGAKEMENASIPDNMHTFSRAQELIFEASGVTPKLFRCNGTEYTEDVLKAAAASGLSAGVEPSQYLNHRSFSSESDAGVFVRRLIRGQIISIKLGQELDLAEYGQQGEVLDERPAIDPSPSISDDRIDTTDWTYQNIVPVVTWLLDALEEAGYTLLTPAALQRMATTLIGDPIALDEETLALLTDENYALPVTDLPLGQGERASAATAADYEGLVFVGDSIMAGLADYVAWRRESFPDYLGGAQFLTATNLSVEGALSPVGSSSVHPELNGAKTTIEDALKAMEAKKVCLMLPFNDLRAYAREDYLINLRLLVHLIQKANPGIRVMVLSYPPGVSGRAGTPTNRQIFRSNLMTCKMCLEYGIDYVDVAYALRDTNGDLPPEYCIDPTTYGTHLSDAGCAALVDYLQMHMP